MFIFESERDRAWSGEGQRAMETQNSKQTPGSELWAEPDVGLKPTDREIMNWTKVGCATDWATQMTHLLLFSFLGLCLYIS